VSDELLYLYAIADAAASGAIVAARLTGIDGGRVAPVVEGRLLGATSVVPASEYDEAPLNEHLQDLDWLAPRAAAHQDVNGRLLEITGGIVPLAFGAIYRGPEGVRTLLEARATDFRARLADLDGRAEWIVSVERADDVPAAQSEALRQLEAEIADAPPGRAFLLGKRREDVLREERQLSDAVIAVEALEALEAGAERVYRETLIDDAALAAVARFSVLVDRSHEAALRDVVRGIERAASARGYRIRLSGPWPAYRFGGLSLEGTLAG